MNDKQKDIDLLFVINPTAGSAAKANFSQAIDHAKKTHRFTYKEFHTKGTDDAAKINIQIKKWLPKIVVACGGDGTVNLVASQLINKDIALGIIPGGSANGLAYNLNIPGNITEAVLALFKHEPRKIDVLHINKQYYCFHLSDIGINARLVKRFEEEGSEGFIGYGKHFLKEMLSRKKIFRVEVQTPSSRNKLVAVSLLIANAQRYGSGVLVSPESKMDDGLLEIVVLKPYPPGHFIKLLIASFTNRLKQMKYIETVQSESVKITIQGEQEMQIDGEPIEGLQHFDVSVIPGAIKVIAPSA